MTKEVDNEALLEALNENVEYINEIAERLNLLAKAMVNMDKRIRQLEKPNG